MVFSTLKKTPAVSNVQEARFQKRKNQQIRVFFHPKAFSISADRYNAASEF
jgi:hypothetical protein|tara:strand:- start:226 stop:378 length:153 start_codon:yes stop_codon:yes gene_type:complete